MFDSVTWNQNYVELLLFPFLGKNEHDTQCWVHVFKRVVKFQTFCLYNRAIMFALFQEWANCPIPKIFANDPLHAEMMTFGMDTSILVII